MARKKKAQPPANTDGWLTTYADLLSLLLCFFVLMYTASTPDEARMQWILRSMTNLSGTVINPIVVDDPMKDSTNGTEENMGPDLPPEDMDGDLIGIPGSEPMTFDDLFNWIADAIDKGDLSSSVSAGMQNGRIHIRFDSDIMFGGNSYALLPEGRDALRRLAPGIRAFNELVASLHVEGHTAPLPPGVTGGVNDWILSSMRSATVVDYLDFGLRMVDSEKFMTAGKAQWAPYYDVLTANERNRRVELVLTRNEYRPDDTSVMIDTFNYDYNMGMTPGDQIGGRTPNPNSHDRVDQIAIRILDKYGLSSMDDLNDSSSGNRPVNEWGPAIPGLPTLPAAPVAPEADVEVEAGIDAE